MQHYLSEETNMYLRFYRLKSNQDGVGGTDKTDKSTSVKDNSNLFFCRCRESDLHRTHFAAWKLGTKGCTILELKHLNAENVAEKISRDALKVTKLKLCHKKNAGRVKDKEMEIKAVSKTIAHSVKWKTWLEEHISV